MTYNGWPNYETWNVMLWLNNDEGTYRYYVDVIQKRKQSRSKYKRTTLPGYAARSIAENAMGPTTGDGVHLSNSRIRWPHIARAMMESA
jgi:hypothetical protein